MEYRETITPTSLNFLFLAIGLIVVWENSHNMWAILGAIIASIHIVFYKPKEQPND